MGNILACIFAQEEEEQLKEPLNKSDIIEWGLHGIVYTIENIDWENPLLFLNPHRETKDLSQVNICVAKYFKSIAIYNYEKSIYMNITKVRANILKPIAYFPSNYAIIFEKLKWPDLYMYRQHNVPSTSMIWKVAHSISKTICVLYLKDIVHNDISLENIGIRENGDIVLFDFGNARLSSRNIYTDIKTLMVKLYEFSENSKFCKTWNWRNLRDVKLRSLIMVTYKSASRKTPPSALLLLYPFLPSSPNLNELIE